MPYADIADVEARLGREITDPLEQSQVTAYIADVSALVDNYTRRSFLDPVPGDVKAVVCNEVISSLNSKPGVTSERVDVIELSYSYATGSGSISNQSKLALRRYRKRFWWASVKRDQDTVNSDAG